MRFNPTARRVYLAPALGLVLITAMSACSSGSSSTQNPQNAQGSFSAAASSVRPSAPSAPAVPPSAGTGGSSSAVSEITTNWNTFFNSSTPNSKRVQLLENGEQFSSAINSLSSTPLASGLSSKVDSVSVTSATKATVKYDLSALGQTVAKGSTGSSVLQNGTWKVGDDVFCGLLTQAKTFGLSVTVPSVCKSASS
jgi:hypothetical protein